MEKFKEIMKILEALKKFRETFLWNFNEFE